MADAGAKVSIKNLNKTECVRVSVCVSPCKGDDTQEQGEAWTEECNQLLGEVLETQTEIACLMAQHKDNTKDLEVMKKKCDEELEALADDAWKLQMFVELQKMGHQLEALASLDEPVAEHDLTQEPTAVQDSSHASTDAAKRQRIDLEQLDREIAALDQELAAARIELQDLLHCKVVLQQEVVLQQ